MTKYTDIPSYNEAQEGVYKEVCEILNSEINKHLPNTQSKVWHGAPVWFINENPIVGYWVRKGYVQLLFWSGQSFDESDLSPEGSFKAAEKRYTDVSEINSDDIKRWLEKAEKIQWDYKNIVKRRGVLERLT